MDLRGKGTILIDAPVKEVYEYLADFSRHSEWERTDEQWELRKPGNDDGVGATYVTYDRRGRGREVSSVKTVRELVRNRRIAWREHQWVIKSFYFDQCLDFVADGADRTQLTQSIHVHVPRLLWWVFVKLAVKFARVTEEDIAELTGDVHDGDESEMLLSIKKAVEEHAGRSTGVVA